MITMTSAAFLRHAPRAGSPLGVTSGAVSTFGSSVVVRRISGAACRTLPALFTEYARAWNFPDHFGNNKDAFDDAARDLNPTLRNAVGGPTDGFLTVVERGEELLADTSETDFAWFADSLLFYRDFYRDQASGPRGFMMVLTCAPDTVAATWQRWADVSVAPILIVDRKGT